RTGRVRVEGGWLPRHRRHPRRREGSERFGRDQQGARRRRLKIHSAEFYSPRSLSVRLASMGFRHTAALSLLGWYLLSPLPRADPKTGAVLPGLVDADRPLQEWTRVKSFQTGGECQAYLKNWIIEQR